MRRRGPDPTNPATVRAAGAARARMPVVSWLRRAAWAVVACVALAACGDDATEAVSSNAAIYAEVVRYIVVDGALDADTPAGAPENDAVEDEASEEGVDGTAGENGTAGTADEAGSDEERGEGVGRPPLVFVRPVAGHAIDLGVQAEVVKRLEKVAVVRFVDEEDEVVLGDKPLQPVRDDAVVVTLGAIVRTGPRAEVHTERYVDRRHVKERCVALRQVAETWQISPPGCAAPA